MDYVNKLYKKINKNNDVVIVFGLSTCGYCNAAIEYLNKNSIPYKYYKINKYYNIFFKILLKLVKIHPELMFDITHKTFPVIFINKKFIGGYSDLIKLL